MSWSFEASLLCFLLIAFASQAIAVATKGLFSLPFALGIISALGFAFGIIPTDIARVSRLRDVGFIAFNVLVVHSGTLINLKAIRAKRAASLIGLVSIVMLMLVFALVLTPVFGSAIALYSVGPVVGGGAANAIASNALFRKAPELAIFPWLIFMFQAFFGLPIFALSLKKEAQSLVKGKGQAFFPEAAAIAEQAASGSGTKIKEALWHRVPVPYRGAAYYLASLMALAFLNNFIYGAFLARFGMHPAMSALVLGIIFGQLGILEPDPLSKADSMGLLMLGLMALMVDAMAQTPALALLKLAPIAIISMTLGTLVLLAVGLLSSRILGLSKSKALMLVSACMVSLPPAAIVARTMLKVFVRDAGNRKLAETELVPDIEVISNIVTSVAAIFAAGIAGVFLR